VVGIPIPDTGLNHTGQPRNAGTFSINNTSGKDLVLTHYDESANAYLGGEIASSGAPTFSNQTTSVFPSQSGPASGATGSVSADYDNDGWVDFFAPDRANGGRLYRNMGGVSYVNAMTSSHLDSVLGIDNYVYSCAWSDYDGDGYVDLTTISGVGTDMLLGHLRVFRNNAGLFELPVIDVYHRAGRSPLWADFDGDGDQDLVLLKSEPDGVVIDPPPDYANYFYIQQSDGTFVDEGWARLGNVFTIFSGTIAGVIDYDNDGDLDIVLAQDYGHVAVLENNAAANPGAGYFSVGDAVTVSPAGAGLVTDLSVIDYDRDGWHDILVNYGSPSQATGSSSLHLLANRTDVPNGRCLEEETIAAGLVGASCLSGIAAADYNSDGYSDLLLTRASNQSFFYKASAPTGHLGSRWLGLRLVSPYGANNYLGIGAQVTVHYGTSTQTRVVDGGSGLSSRMDDDLVFGFGTYSGPLEIEVVWPNGHTQTLESATLNQLVTITDDTPVLDMDSISFSKRYILWSGKVDWIFTWETYNYCDSLCHSIDFDLTGVSPECLPPCSQVVVGQANVELETNPLGSSKIEHILKLTDLDCESGCRIPYTVECGVSDYTINSEGESNAVRIDSCVQKK